MGSNPIFPLQKKLRSNSQDSMDPICPMANPICPMANRERVAWAVALYFLRGESGESEANVGAKYSHMVT